MCRWIVRLFAVLYAIALALLVIGTYGLFGQDRDPLSGVFLILLGMPWVYPLDGLPDRLAPWLAAATPLINLAILAGICRLIRLRSRNEPPA